MRFFWYIPSFALFPLYISCHQPSVFFTLLHTLDFEVILGVLQDAREAFAVASRDYRCLLAARLVLCSRPLSRAFFLTDPTLLGFMMLHTSEVVSASTAGTIIFLPRVALPCCVIPSFLSVFAIYRQ